MLFRVQRYQLTVHGLVLGPVHGALSELHIVLSQSPRLVCKHVLYLSQLFVEI